MSDEKHCPLCDRVWMPTPWDDYMLPACGCYGDDHDARDIPCEACGLPHAWRCVTGGSGVPRLVTVDENGVEL